MENRSIPKIILSHMIGLIVIIILLIIVNNYITTTNQVLIELIAFFNLNILLIVVMTMMFMIADIFYTFDMPLNLPGPIISALGSLFVIKFIFSILQFIDLITKFNVFAPLNWILWLIYPGVFVMVLISGYMSILYKLVTSPRTNPEEEKVIDITPKNKNDKNKDNKNKGAKIGKDKVRSWNDIGNEFKNLLYDTFSGLRKDVNKDKEKKKK